MTHSAHIQCNSFEFLRYYREYIEHIIIFVKIMKCCKIIFIDKCFIYWVFTVPNIFIRYQMGNYLNGWLFYSVCSAYFSNILTKLALIICWVFMICYSKNYILHICAWKWKANVKEAKQFKYRIREKRTRNSSKKTVVLRM